MRKILIAILIILLLALAFTVVFNGMHIQIVDVLSYGELGEKNKELDEAIKEATRLTGITFKESQDNLTSTAKKLTSKKEEYQDKVAYSSEEEVRRATEIKTYQIDYLFSHIGNYAENKFGLDLKLDAMPTSATGVYDINFTVKGRFALISDFIRAIENDDELNFVIEKFKILPGENEEESKNAEILRATFTVSQIRLDVDNSITNTSASDSEDDEKLQATKNNP